MAHSDTTIRRHTDPGATPPPETGARARVPTAVPTAVAAVVGAVLIAATALIHLHLWKTGYRHIATIGPLFLFQAVAGFVLAVVVALWHRWYVAAAGALFLVGTAGGLVVSARWGLFGFKDSFSAPYAGMVLSLEVAGAVVLAALAGFLIRRPRH